MKILFGVPSEGMGHATRSRVVIEYLISQNHDIRIVSSDRAFNFLAQHFGERVIKIEGFHLAYRNAKVSIGHTVLLNVKNMPAQLLTNYKAYKKIIENFLPQIVISDFESFTNVYAKAHSLPLISIDNMQILNRAALNIQIPKKEKQNYMLAKAIVKSKVPDAHHYFITSFFYPEIKKKHTSYVAPIIRKEIMKAKNSYNNHLVVYQTTSSQQSLIPMLQSMHREKFIVYGFNKDENHGNVILKSFSEQEFIRDFASAKAVLSNGGFSFISEAVFLKKPICCVPIANQFEQFVNASYIDKLQYGRHFEEFNPDQIKSFLYDLPIFYESLKAFVHDGHQALFQGLDKVLKNDCS